jgi:glyoxylase-like metal-dependent hydrolase (beta-lactamase superfamily II)
VQIVEVAENIHRIEARPSGSPFTFSVFFIRDVEGAIIEPGPAAMVPAIREAVDRLAMQRIRYIIPTHIHVDHGGAIGTLATIFPGAEVVVNERGARHAADPERLIRSTRMSFGDDYESMFGPILPVPPPRLKVIRDGDRLEVGSRELQLFETTGHAPHHISILDTKSGCLFCGEALGLVYGPGEPPLPATTLPNFDAKVYLSDMRRLRALNPRILFYSHLGIGREPARDIDMAIENTIVFGQIVTEAMAAQKDEEERLLYINRGVVERLGVSLSDYELRSNARAFIDYYTRHRS